MAAATRFRLGFLGLRPFCLETVVFRYWILLDFLGFSRQNQDFSMGYDRFIKKTVFSRALYLALDAPDGNIRHCVDGCRIVHRRSIDLILIFRKKFLPRR
jgi:hypothetical protein